MFETLEQSSDYKKGLTMPPDTTTLPELRGGELLLNPRSGKTYRVHKVANKGQFASAYDEKLYRLENIVLGNRRWTLEELADQGLKIIEEG
jgi:hypothetical protein